jgi:PAS domain S-box-containing protein
MQEVGSLPSDETARLFELSLDLLGTAGPEGYFRSLNPAWERTLGFPREALMGQPYLEFVHPADRERTVEEAAALLREGHATLDFENRYAVKDGGWCWLSWRTEVAGDGIAYFVARDVTDRVAADQQRRMMTSLVERADDAIFSKTLDGVITSWNRAAEDLYGWTEEEAVGRHIRDLIIPPARASESEEIVERLLRGEGVRQYLTERRRKDGRLVRVAITASPIRDSEDRVTGAAVMTRDLSDLDVGLAHARAQIDSMAWVGRIRDAIDHGRFVFHAQPIRRLGQPGAPGRHELLCRIAEPDGSLLAPGLFMRAAESYGLIEEIDALAIRAAVRLAAAGHGVNVNLGAASVTRAATAGFLQSELEAAGADPALLTIELTETALMNDLDAAKRFTDAISAIGAKIALDDFGTGFGGFTYLKRLNIQQLKIDTEFVRDLPTSEASRHVVQAVVSLARRFGLETVAEGVEDEGTLATLAGYGVDWAQGFHLGRPAPLADALGWEGPCP